MSNAVLTAVWLEDDKVRPSGSPTEAVRQALATIDTEVWAAIDRLHEDQFGYVLGEDSHTEITPEELSREFEALVKQFHRAVGEDAQYWPTANDSAQVVTYAASESDGLEDWDIVSFVIDSADLVPALAEALGIRFTSSLEV